MKEKIALIVAILSCIGMYGFVIYDQFSVSLILSFVYILSVTIYLDLKHK